MKILIADDQIPEDSIADDAVRDVISKRYPSERPGFINAFVLMRKMVNRLRDAGFEVHVCNKVAQVEETIKNGEYHLAIIDLGWRGDMHVKSERETHGWTIVEDIQHKYPKLSVIMFSNRFLERGDIAIGAAERKVLPIYKNYNSPELFEICITNLIAAIRFIERSKEKAFGEKVKIVDLETYKILSKITISLFVVALIFVVIGISLLYTKNIQAGVVTSAISIFSSVISGLFWKYLRKIRQNITS